MSVGAFPYFMPFLDVTMLSAALCGFALPAGAISHMAVFATSSRASLSAYITAAMSKRHRLRHVTENILDMKP